MQNEGITGSEVAIDHFLNGKLSERFSVKNYPARVGESLVLFDPALKPKGAIIIGAGEITEFNAYRLKRAVESGVINYAMHLRDNVNNKWLDSDQSIERGKFMSSISCLCIGTGFGRISMEDSLRAIITGIQSANEIIGSIKDLQKIVHVEFIELYEHIAQNIFYQLSLFKTSTDRQLNITLTQKEVGRKSGALKKFQFYTENSWWHNFTTRFVEKDIDDKNKVKKIPRLQFASSSGIARVVEENTFTPNEVVDSLLKELSANPTWDKRSSKTLFELLIPYQFKDIIRQQNNILWRLDLQSAAYPWEMFHDHEQDEVPTFVTAGLIRQLYSFNSAGRKDIIRNKKALVIGDPDYTGTGLNQLPGAWNEALLVHQLLEASDFTSNLLPQHSKGEEVLNSLYNDEYKILHVSGHGVVEDEEYKTGVALSNNMMITPSMFGNLSRLPEFVFINCCSLGEIIPGKEKYFQERYKFAANIGTELIKIGVNAVIVAGWPVSDRAAVKFAESFYSNFLKGYQFGESVKRARKSCYDDYHESNNTWAAYQCYGDPWYRLTQSTGKDNSIPEYIAEDEVLADLYNIKSDTETLDSKPSASIEIKDRLEKIIKRAKNFSSGKIKEKEAEILSEIDDLEEAIKKLEELRKINKADYSIKAIEQYCNLRMKHLLTKRIKSTDKKGLASLAKEMKQIEKDFINLQLMGDTSERSSLMGSAYKKLATIRFYHKGLSKSIPSTAIYIEQAEKNYKAAYRLLDPNMLSQVVYPLTNWLQLHAINGWKEKINIDDKKQVDIYEYLVQKSKDLRGSFGKNIDFWEDISLVNLLQTTLYYVPRIKASKDNDVKNENKANQLKVIQELGKDITSHYISAWKDGGTLRQLQAEMEQTQFMLDMLISVKREVHWKSEMKKALNGIMKELQALRNEK
ncbi:MAG: CHAT domain-containing protein [Saprospiraceae bacterium]